MTREKKIELLGLLMEDETVDAAILGLYIDLAEQKVLNRMYPYVTDYEGLEVPDRYVSAQLKIAHYMLNKRGAEGQIQHIENGIHRNYGAADIPDGMMAEIVPFCQAIR